MRVYWQPFSDNERGALEFMQEDRIVELNDSLRHPGHKVADGGESSSSAVAARGRACALAESTAPLAGVMDPRLADEISAELGSDMKERYDDLLSKRDEAAGLLRFLCHESFAEADPERRVRLETGAVKMAAILEELRKHSLALGVLFERREGAKAM